MDDKKVSFVIPCYNVENYISECLNSILSQSYSNIEIVIVDSSTDNTKEVIKNFEIKTGNEKIKYFYQEGKGPASARNFGIEMSNGDYIAFLDADDLLCPDSIQKRIKLFESEGSVGMVYSNAYIMNENKLLQTTFRDIVNGSHEGHVFEKLIKNNFICTSTVLVSKSVLEKVGVFDESLKNAEDYGLWLRISGYGYSIGLVDEPLTYYRIRKGSLSENNLRNTEYLISLFNKMKLQAENFSTKERKLIDNNIKRFHADYFIIKAKKLIVEGEYNEALKCYLKLHKLKGFDIKYYIVLVILKFFPGLLGYVLKKRKSHRGV